MDNFTAVCAFEAATFLIWSEPKRENFIADTLKKKKKVKSEDNGEKRFMDWPQVLIYCLIKKKYVTIITPPPLTHAQS